MNLSSHLGNSLTAFSRRITNFSRSAFNFPASKFRNYSVSSGFNGIGRLNHVAIVCPDLKKSSDMYQNVLGADVSPPVDIPEHGVTTVFVTLNNTKIELLHPLGENSPIRKWMEKNVNGGLHHICLEVDDIHKAVEQMKKFDVRTLDKVKPGAHGLPVIFLHPKDMGQVLIELEEIKHK